MKENDTHEELAFDKQEDSTNQQNSVHTAEPTTEEPVLQANPGTLKKMEDELAEAKEKYIRLYAEFDNFRKRSAKERLDLIQLANEKLILSLLSVADDFERAEKSFKEKNDKELEGFFLIHSKFQKVLEKYHVKHMGTKTDEVFNPDIHEAITQIPSTDEKQKGRIVDIIEKGYLLNDKVIRFAKVVIGC